MICDTTRASIDETVDYILDAYEGRYREDIAYSEPPLLMLDPARIYPTQSIYGLRGLREEDTGSAQFAGHSGRKALEAISVGYTGDHYFVVNGHHRLSAALQNKFTLIAGRLVAQGDDC